MSATPHKQKPTFSFFEIRLGSVPLDVPLDYDLLLEVNSKPVLFRKRGNSISQRRMKLLERYPAKKFMVPGEQRTEYLRSLRRQIQDPGTVTDVKARFIKETAFLHVEDLFTKPDISSVIVDSTSLIEEMVSFVSADIQVASSLLKLSIHDEYTYNHSVDVAVLAIAMAKRVFGDEKQLLMTAGLGGLLHDIGKRLVAPAIINKSGKLSPEEWVEIKKHPSHGVELIANLDIIPQASRLIVLEHHENFNGTGYPKGLKEEEISSLARLVAIADVFDAITTNRSYSKAMSAKEALETMHGMQPGKFDPTFIKNFDKNLKRQTQYLPLDFDPCHPYKKIKPSSR